MYLGDRVETAGPQSRDLFGRQQVGGRDRGVEVMAPREWGKREQAGTVAVHDERDRPVRLRNRTALRQGECLGHERIREIAREHGNHECCRGRCQRERSRCPRTPAGSDPSPGCENESGGVVVVCEQGRRLRGFGSEGDLQLLGRACVHDQPERGHLPREQRRMTTRRSVGDDRAAAHERLQARDAAGRVDERSAAASRSLIGR